MKKSITLVLVLTLVMNIFILGGCSNQEAGEEEYPNKPIEMIVNYGGGGSTDLTCRALSRAAEEYLGQPITIVNKSGGSGTTGIIEVNNSEPDGYTLGTLTYAPLAIVPHQMEVPYTPEDFEFILGYGEYLYGIAVKADSPYETIDDLVKVAREEDGLAFSASGYPQPFVMNDIGKQEDVEFIYTPYKSGNEAVTAVLGGHVEVTVGIITSVVPFLESGELKLLASASPKRWDAAPDVPTLEESGYDTSIISYLGIGAPKGVSEEKLEILRDAFKKAFENEEFQSTMEKTKIPAVYTPGEDYKQFAIEGYDINKALIEEMNQ